MSVNIIVTAVAPIALAAACRPPPSSDDPRAADGAVPVEIAMRDGRERLGFDYNDEEAVAEQFEFARGAAMNCRHSPVFAILTGPAG